MVFASLGGLVQPCGWLVRWRRRVVLQMLLPTRPCCIPFAGVEDGVTQEQCWIRCQRRA
uniref:Uncharacterized protein n=1 Tax=Arundo donax TaxID=35708 RepID=A0A0A9F5F5_ARUDO